MVIVVDASMTIAWLLPDESPETDARAWRTIPALARDQALTVYDAAYLELAIRTRAHLASFDVDLVAAARRCGVTIFGDVA